jgi:GalNAc-alpha-(1->4)-GalNAc-alpha-(1->3)-diNAcBac-PP-undecaprenol alpha-1,4-N-acetyl-D-galactosaminyltransferase
MKVLFVISALSPGGAERVVSIMANYWARKEWTVTVLTLDDGMTPPFFRLDGSVQHIPLDVASESAHGIAGFWNNVVRILSLRRSISQNMPEVVISFVDKTNVLTILATLGLRCRLLVSERTDPRLHSIGNVWEQLRWWTYGGADRIVVQSQDALNYFLPKFQSRTAVIPNPVVLPPSGETLLENQRTGLSIIAMGRLSEEKCFDILLRAFVRLKERHPNWALTILGEGPQRPVLESLREQLGVVESVFLPGIVKNPEKYLMNASLFVLSSRFEGFPNSLCEAMACGLPVIATDCSSGLREIIRHGEDGILVPPNDVNALANAMDRLMSDKGERRRLASRAVDVASRFNLEKIMGMWEEVLRNVKREATV